VTESPFRSFRVWRYPRAARHPRTRSGGPDGGHESVSCMLFVGGLPPTERRSC